MYAPSAGNQQPWHFVVVDDRALLDAVPSFHPHAAMCREAACAILVCADPALEKYPGLWVQDCAAATQNILLAAHELGLGSVWLGCYPRPERVEGFRRLVGLPPEIIPFAMIALGYPAQTLATPERFNPDRVHRNRW